MKIKLKEVIGQFLNSSDQSSHQFLRLWNMAVWGLKTEFNLDITGTIQTLVLDVNPNKTVNLPCNYIQYLKIGVLNHRGEVVTFKRNDQLSTINLLGSDNRMSEAPMSPSYSDLIGYNLYNNYYYNYFFNGVSYKLFGADSGTSTIAEYKVDEEQGLIFLSPDCSYGQIVLEYLSDGYDDDYCDFMVDIKASEALIAYLRWKNSVDMKKKYSSNDIRGFKLEFYREKRLAKMRINPFILNEAQHAIRVGTKLTAKA